MARRRRLPKVPAAALACLLLAMTGCSRVSPNAAVVAAQPNADAMRPATPYSAALRCIHDQIGTAPGPRITLTIGSVPDSTGRITPGLRDMITSAVADVALGDGHFDLAEIAVREGNVGSTGVRPEQGGALIGLGAVRQGSGLQLIGALTQADRSNQSSSLSAGGAYQENTVDAGSTDELSTVALDLRLVDVSKGLSVTQATRSMLAVRSTGFSADAGLSIGRFGANFSYSLNKREGAHQAVRTLVELSVAELLGQAARVPYWTCLSIDRTHPAVQAQIERWYRGMTQEALEADVRDRLRSRGMPVPPMPEPATTIIMDFQRANGLVPTGRPSFETFALLVASQLPRGLPTDSLPEGLPPSPPAPPQVTRVLPGGAIRG